MYSPVAAGFNLQLRKMKLIRVKLPIHYCSLTQQLIFGVSTFKLMFAALWELKIALITIFTLNGMDRPHGGTAQIGGGGHRNTSVPYFFSALSDTPYLDIVLSSSGMERSFLYQVIVLVVLRVAGFLTSTVQDLQWSPNQEELPHLFLESRSPLFSFTFLATSTLSTRWRQIPIIEDGSGGPKNSHLSCGWILKEYINFASSNSSRIYS
ncbi:uncharacterized protein LOC110320855 [Mus pahari]|uniref:uncharacterized protein LOC110320855 n=1 Tax=Mus pahari TaxID=10093 RepID=UPI000A3059BD|nr:uncharacterized protein LOC110320855 [Mus pahari]